MDNNLVFSRMNLLKDYFTNKGFRADIRSGLDVATFLQNVHLRIEDERYCYMIKVSALEYMDTLENKEGIYFCISDSNQAILTISTESNSIQFIKDELDEFLESTRSEVITEIASIFPDIKKSINEKLKI